MSTTHVKVARCIINPQNGTEFILPLGNGGEVQIWERKIWERYLAFINENPKCRGSREYPWTYVEDTNPPNDDLRNYVLLPEKTNGKEFLTVNPTEPNPKKQRHVTNQ